MTIRFEKLTKYIAIWTSPDGDRSWRSAEADSRDDARRSLREHLRGNAAAMDILAELAASEVES